MTKNVKTLNERFTNEYFVFTKKILHRFVSFCISLIFMYCLFVEKKLVTIKGQLQWFCKLVSYERAVKILKDDICITKIGQAVLEIFDFKVKFPRKIPKIRNFANVSIIRVEQ